MSKALPACESAASQLNGKAYSGNGELKSFGAPQTEENQGRANGLALFVRTKSDCTDLGHHINGVCVLEATEWQRVVPPAPDCCLLTPITGAGKIRVLRARHTKIPPRSRRSAACRSKAVIEQARNASCRLLHDLVTDHP